MKWSGVEILLMIFLFPFSLIYIPIKKRKVKSNNQYLKNKNNYQSKNSNNVRYNSLCPNSYNTVVTLKGVILDKKTISTKFDLYNISEFQQGCYLISPNDTHTITEDILELNQLLFAAHKTCTFFPLRKISKENLFFTKRIVNGSNAFCFISFEPRTQTGKEAKYPIVFHLNVTPNFFGEIYYLQNGQIGKARIIAWSNNQCFELSLLMLNGNLSVNNIYQIDTFTGKKNKLYSAK